MFTSARIKLTAWYLAIIMLISIVFSIVIYQGANNELGHIQARQKFRVERFRGEFLGHPAFIELFEPIPVDAIRRRMVAILVFFNGGILAVSGMAGYFLAGKTLSPIKKMVDEQDRFITDASHELRTPITALKSEIEVALRNKKLTLNETKKLITSNLEEVNHLQALSDNLLELTQLTKPTSLMFQLVSLKNVISEAKKKILPLAKEKRVGIRTQIADITLEADADRLREVFIILLDNAVKYSNPGSAIDIHAKAEKQTVRVDIIDHGIGIEKKDIPRIFDRLFRADSARLRRGPKGYGLGLSIAKRIIEKHQGTITVKSLLEKGTTFSVYLPFTRKHARMRIQ